MRLLALIFAAVLLQSCGNPNTVSYDDFKRRAIRLPDGATIQAEVMTDPMDMMRGMMYRDSLDADKGMLFIHGAPGKYPYWMHNVRIPLDMMWLDRNGAIVELIANVPPCVSKSAKDCPNYGGNHDALYILELAGGVAARHGLKTGDTLRLQ